MDGKGDGSCEKGTYIKIPSEETKEREIYSGRVTPEETGKINLNLGK